MMKKFITILTTLSMLLGALAAMTTGAFAEVPINYDDHLITYWDFEGENPYADKAAVGSSSDTLIPGGTVEVTNGVANVSNVSSKLSASGAEGTDLYSLQNKTVVIKMTAPIVREDKKNGIGLMSKSNAATVGLNADNTLTLRSFAGEGSDYRLHNTTDASSWEEAQTAFRYFVFSYTYDAATGEYTESYYISNTDTPESGEDWVPLKTVTGTLTDEAQKLSYLTSSADLVFGPNGNDRRFSASYDEIRIYDIAISINATGTQGGNDEEESGDNTEESSAPTGDGTDNTPESKDPVTTDRKEPASTDQITDSGTGSANDSTGSKGCSSVVGVGAIVLISFLSGAVILKKKKG